MYCLRNRIFNNVAHLSLLIRAEFSIFLVKLVVKVTLVLSEVAIVFVLLYVWMFSCFGDTINRSKLTGYHLQRSVTTYFLHWIFLRSKHITNLLGIVGGPPSLWVKRASETIGFELIDNGRISGRVLWKWLTYELIARVWRNGWGHKILAFRTAIIPLFWLAIRCSSIEIHYFIFAHFHFFTHCTSFPSVLPGLPCLFICYHFIGKVINYFIHGALLFYLNLIVLSMHLH